MQPHESREIVVVLRPLVFNLPCPLDSTCDLKLLSEVLSIIRGVSPILVPLTSSAATARLVTSIENEWVETDEEAVFFVVEDET